MRQINFQRYRAYDEARRIEWRGDAFAWTPEFGTQLVMAQSVLRPDGPFPAMTDQVRCVVGNKILTLGRAEVDELLVLALEASVRAMEVIKAATEETPNGPPA